MEIMKLYIKVSQRLAVFSYESPGNEPGLRILLWVSDLQCVHRLESIV